MSGNGPTRHKDAWKHELAACFDRFVNERQPGFDRGHAYRLFLAELIRWAMEESIDPEMLADDAAGFAIVFDGDGNPRPEYIPPDEDDLGAPQGGVQ